MPTATAPSDLVITSEALREHWQGHRRLTRRVIEAFCAFLMRYRPGTREFLDSEFEVDHET